MEFAEAVETVLRDLRAQCEVQPDIRWDDATGITLLAPDGSGQGLTPHPDGTAAELLVHLADQVQDWAVEALWSEGVSAVWPQCPTHPDTHPLTATVRHRCGGVGMPEDGDDGGADRGTEDPLEGLSPVVTLWAEAAGCD